MAAHETQLARVETTRPRVLLLVQDDGMGEGSVKARAVAQIRPRLLHYVENGQLMCVIRSRADIGGLARVSETQILVSTADGAVWHVCLPSGRLGARPIMLEATSRKQESGVAVRQVATVPGARLIEYTASVDTLVVTSLIMPTTVICGVLSTAAQHTLELDALEGEQSTSLVVLRVEQLDGEYLKAVCLGTPQSTSPAAIVILLGDADGWLRLAIVDTQTCRTIYSADLIHVKEQVDQVLPIRVSNSVTVNTILALGVESAVVVVTASTGGFTSHHSRFSHRIISMATLYTDQSARLLLASPSLGITQFDIHQFISNISCINSADSIMLNSGNPVSSIPRDAVHICSDHNIYSSFVGLLTSSGRILLLTVRYMTRQSDLIEEISQSVTSSSSAKSLLQEIGQISDESRRLRVASTSADYLLRGLDSTLHFLRLVAVNGIDQLLRLDLRLELQNSGWCMQSKQARMCFTLRGATGEAQDFLDNRLLQDMWRVQLAVTTGSNALSSYSLRLSECLQEERVILLDENLLPNQLEGVIHITCHLLFSAETREMSPPKDNSVLASISIPVLENERVHLVQLSQPIKDYSQNPVAVREQFDQNLKLLGHDQDGPALQGPAWWSTVQQDGLDCLDPDLAVSPTLPLRFVFHVQRTDTQSNDEDEVLVILKELMNIRSQGQMSLWKQSLRNAGQKWWIGMHTYNGNLIVLRFAAGGNLTADKADEDHNHDEDGNRLKAHSTIEVTVYASSVTDLSAMRALLIVTRTKTTHSSSPILHPDRTSLALTTLRGEIADLSAAVEDVKRKVNAAGLIGAASESSDICQEELLQLLQRAATAEIRTLEVYWKSREILNHHIAF